MNDSRRGFLTKFAAFLAGAAAPTKVVEFFADPTSEIEQKLLDAYAEAWAESAPLEDVIYSISSTDVPLNTLAQNGMGALKEWDEDGPGVAYIEPRHHTVISTKHPTYYVHEPRVGMIGMAFPAAGRPD